MTIQNVDWPKCWCGKYLVEQTPSGFPLGFLNCPVHGCEYEVKPKPKKKKAITK